MNCFKACFGKGKPEATGNYLYAFDYDQTILKEDSEAAVTAVLHSPIPDDMLMLYDGENWAEFCGMLIDYVIETGATMQEMQQCIRDLTPLPGMKTLLHKIHLAVTENPNSHFIIVSGANDFFIRTFLEGMRPPIVPTQIISNHAELSQATPQTLIFRPYENQRTCPICPHFLCKGNQYFYGCLTREWIPNTKIVSSGGALRSYIDAHGPFTQVYYCADGCNDVCPAQELSAKDILFVRENFELDRVIRFGFYGGRQIKIKAQIIYFQNAKQIAKNMKF